MELESCLISKVPEDVILKQGKKWDAHFKGNAKWFRLSLLSASAHQHQQSIFDITTLLSIKKPDFPRLQT